MLQFLFSSPTRPFVSENVMKIFRSVNFLIYYIYDKYEYVWEKSED